MDTIKLSFEKAKAKSQELGVQIELLISGGESLSLGYQKKALSTFKSSQSQMAGFRVINGSSQGYAYTENLGEESLLRTFNDAYENSITVKSEGKEVIHLMKPQVVTAMNDVVITDDKEMELKHQVARQLESLCLEKDSRITAVPYSGFNQGTSFKRILNSEGLDQTFTQSYYSGYAYSLAKEGEVSKTGGKGFFTRNFSDINVEKIASESVKKAVSMLPAKPLETGNYAVVLDREVFGAVLNMLEDYFSAKTVSEGKSILENKLNQTVASSKFTLVDDPFNKNGTGVRPFDDEGAPSQKTVLIENGVLKNYLTNLEYASKMKLPHTASAARSPASPAEIASSNLVVAKGDQSQEQLLKSHKQVVHLTHFSGGLHAGFKSTTGDFSMPAEGFLYVDGVLQGPVDQFVVSGNVLELLAKIQAVGNTYNEPGSSMITPDVLVESLSFAGAN